MQGTIYFHSPCFDGIVSAVLAWDFHAARCSWLETELVPVNYHLRDGWLTQALARPAAVVDFLYHPHADFWIDHHPTTFLDTAVRRDYDERRGPGRHFDATAKSCAGLIGDHLREAFDYENPAYHDLVQWAEKTDSASYETVDEAIFGDAPALRINAVLAQHGDPDLCCELVRALREQPLDEVAQRPQIVQRYDQVRSATESGLQRVAPTLERQSDAIVTFDVDAADVLIPRYAAFWFHPDARYSAGIVRHGDGAKITAMRNPWLDFPSAPLGRIFAEFGGGGHERVASLVLKADRASEARDILRRIVVQIRCLETAPLAEARR